MSIFGRIISDDQVEDAIMATLKTWLSTELAEVEEQRGLARGYYKRPLGWQVRNDFTSWPEEQLPLIIVISPGLADDPKKEGRGLYRATWVAGVAGVVSNVDQLRSRRNAYRMGAAIRAALVHHQSLDQALGNSVRGVTWIDGRNNDIPDDDGRNLWATRQLFHVEVGDVLTHNAGPAFPDPPTPDPTPGNPDPTPIDPHPDWDLVETATTTLTKEPIE